MQRTESSHFYNLKAVSEIVRYKYRKDGYRGWWQGHISLAGRITCALRIFQITCRRCTGERLNSNVSAVNSLQIIDVSVAYLTRRPRICAEDGIGNTQPNHRAFYSFDSIPDETIAKFIPHTAFQDPTSPKGTPHRQSIEIRALVFYDWFLQHRAVNLNVNKKLYCTVLCIQRNRVASMLWNKFMSRLFSVALERMVAHSMMDGDDRIQGSCKRYYLDIDTRIASLKIGSAPLRTSPQHQAFL